MLSGVITTDFVNSSQLDKGAEKKFRQLLQKELAGRPHEFYRGDSMQIYVKDARDSLRLALLVRTAARKLKQEGKPFDLRTSIGIGSVKQPVRSPGTAKGEAFVLSGRSFDEYIIGDKRFILRCGRQPFDTSFEIMGAFIDDIFIQMTGKQATIVYVLLAGLTQEEAAKKLKKSQPTISKQARSARWLRLQELLIKFEELIKLLAV